MFAYAVRYIFIRRQFHEKWAGSVPANAAMDSFRLASLRPSFGELKQLQPFRSLSDWKICLSAHTNHG